MKGISLIIIHLTVLALSCSRPFLFLPLCVCSSRGTLCFAHLETLSPLSSIYFSSCFVPRSHQVFCSSVKGIRKLESRHEMGRRGRAAGREAAGKMERFGRLFRVAKDQTVLFFFLIIHTQERNVGCLAPGASH